MNKEEAIKKIRKSWDFLGNDEKEVLETLIPELKESEDEMIRKELIEHIKANCESDFILFQKFSPDDVIAWLEKQGEQKPILDVEIPFGAKDSELEEVGYSIPNGYHAEIKDNNIVIKKSEQKPADKVEPKFYEGDWVVCELTGSVYQIKNCIENLSNHKYGYELINGGYIGSDETERYHLWTIQDAKDGDVIAWDNSKCIALFKNIYDEESFNSYGFVGHCTGAFESRLSYHDIEGAHPATKEQRDFLFSKMKEADYEWDEEKKVLKWIKQVDDFDTELKESKDEMIRKALIQGFNECLNSSSHYPKNAIKYWHGIVIEDIIAWLENLEEQQ